MIVLVAVTQVYHRRSRLQSERGAPRAAGLDAVVQLAALVTSTNDCTVSRRQHPQSTDLVANPSAHM